MHTVFRSGCAPLSTTPPLWRMLAHRRGRTAAAHPRCTDPATSPGRRLQGLPIVDLRALEEPHLRRAPVTPVCAITTNTRCRVSQIPNQDTSPMGDQNRACTGPPTRARDGSTGRGWRCCTGTPRRRCCVARFGRQHRNFLCKAALPAVQAPIGVSAPTLLQGLLWVVHSTQRGLLDPRPPSMRSGSSDIPPSRQADPCPLAMHCGW